MFRMSKKMIYALEAVLDIAYNGRQNPVQSRDITKRQGIPQRYLEQVMQHMVKANILKGVRGPRGGYVLARERRRITVAEIIDVVNNMDQKSRNTEYESQSSLGIEVINPLIDTLNNEFMDRLGTISLQDLCTQASQQGIQAEDDQSFTFNI